MGIEILYVLAFKTNGSSVLEKVVNEISVMPVFETSEGASKYLVSHIDEKCQEWFEVRRLELEVVYKTRAKVPAGHSVYIDIRA